MSLHFAYQSTIVLLDQPKGCSDKQYLISMVRSSPEAESEGHYLSVCLLAG
jgi:hypothetical protein